MRQKGKQATETETATSTTASGAKQHVAVRLDASHIARVDEEVRRMAGAMPGYEVRRSDALRALVLRGLDASEAERARAVRRGRGSAAGVEGEGVVLGTGGPVAVEREV